MNKTKQRIKELEREIKEFFTCPYCGKKLKLYQECKHNKNPKIFQIVDEPLELKTELQTTKQTLKEVEEVIDKRFGETNEIDKAEWDNELKKEIGLEEK